jgi:TonB family protein
MGHSKRVLLCAAALLLSSVAVAQQPPPQAPAAPAVPAAPSAPVAPVAPAAPAPAAPDDGAPKPPVLVPPKLKTFVEAPYPPDAMAQGLQAVVELEMLVQPDGTVGDVKLRAPQGHGFDEAALEAGKKFVFDPATRDGVPIPARIVFPYVFEIKVAPPPPEEEAAPEPARLDGIVLNDDDKQPLAGVEVLLSNDELKIARRAVTDDKGAFVFEELPAGNYHIVLSKREWTTQEADDALSEGEATSVTYRLVPAADPEAFRAVARVPPPPREVTRRTIGKEELTRIPGTRGDALRTVELLPGVARPPLGAGLLIVRGSAPQDTQVFLEGVPVPLLYHFGGLTSFINSRLLESVDFYPGNFSARYGRRRGGIIEANLADPPRDQVHAFADLNFIDGSVLVHGPITDRWGFAAAVRRSWIDLVFEQVLDSDDVSAVAAPVYYDYQALTTYRPTDRDKLRLMVYGSSDNLELLFTEPSDQDAAISGDFGFATQFHRVHATWSRKVSDRVDHDLEIAAGTFDIGIGVGSAFSFDLSGIDTYLRSEWRSRLSDTVQLITGADVLFLPGKVEYSGPPIQQDENNPDANAAGTTISNRDRVSAVDEFTVVQPAVYIETDFNFDPTRVVLGLRADYFSEIEAGSVDPRLSAHYRLTDDTRLKAGVGLFSQPPQFQESSPAFGNPDLRPTHTVHVGTGFDHDLMENFTFGVEGFFKYLYDRVIGSEFGEAPYFKNGGRGRIYGMELSAKVNPTGRFFGYLSYTLSRSEREDRNEGYELFDFDQPHILTVSGTYRLGRGWEAGFTYRLVSGNPDTPVIGAVYNVNTGQYSPIFGRTNSLRTPLYHRLDARVEKLWTFDHWKLALYLDVQNVYNATNAEGLVYDFEYRKSMQISGLPIFPNLGIRGEI